MSVLGFPARVRVTTAFAFTTLAACTSTQIDSGPNHPASPQAATAPLPSVGGELSQADGPAAMPTQPEGAPGHSHGESSKGDGQETLPAVPATSGTGTATPEAPHSSHASEGSTPAAAHAHPPAGAAKDASKQWTCTMHPEVRQSEPGKCSKCGMTLVPVESEQQAP
jgi:hypothetical protein